MQFLVNKTLFLEKITYIRFKSLKYEHLHFVMHLHFVVPPPVGARQGSHAPLQLNSNLFFRVSKIVILWILVSRLQPIGLLIPACPFLRVLHHIRVQGTPPFVKDAKFPAYLKSFPHLPVPLHLPVTGGKFQKILPSENSKLVQKPDRVPMHRYN